MRFGMLGPFDVTACGAEVRFGGRMCRRLVGRLLLESPRPVSRSVLVEHRWDGQPADAAAATLRSHATAVRAAWMVAGWSPTRLAPAPAGAREVVPLGVGFEVAVPRLMPAGW